MVREKQHLQSAGLQEALLNGCKIDLSECKDVSQFLLREGKTGRKAEEEIELKEIGPRLTLQLHKIEEPAPKKGVLFHSEIVLSKKEQEQKRSRRIQKEKLKEERRKTQESNVLRKQTEKEERKEDQRQRLKKKMANN